MTQFRTLAAVALGCGLIGFAGFAAWAKHGESQRFAAIPPALLGESVAQIERGRYVAAMADCAACHTVPGKPEYAGGYSLQTPFGSIQASNITQDPETGIGSWSLEQFDKAVRHGIGRHGYLYPAMPYPAYAKMSDADITDLWAYIKTVEPVHQTVVENQLPFPYNQRFLLAGWNLLFFKDQPFTPQAGVSAQVNRGDYLVNGPGHCAACHTGKNLLGGDLAGALHGGTLQGWHAPDLTPNPHVGLGKWASDDLVRYLKTGSNHQAAASGPMLEAVENSTQHLTDADLYAIAAYLQQLPASAEQPGPAIAADDPQMVTGKRVVESQCEACHRRDGHGVRNMIPALRDNAQVNARDAASLINIVLRGAEGPVTAGNPTGAGMPRFDWKMADEDIAAALTYIRNSWGNSAARVSAADVSRARTALGAEAWLMR
ncbi:Nicotinate dehydrogenase subunit B [Pseudomonas reidholzensis]|uniref:Nicotinate dehydrogenase subunit B n=1 Tax=Pseudomonas reidholzensis TaxID=1785162 RepID=A0A383RTV3_9PSED|nr:c-type cytochrome [Pseudomonas reidholzensis]SYX90480.1 Nicotinate dehydrogenase subunit B [Pseudomonas reidholzensis]